MKDITASIILGIFIKALAYFLYFMVNADSLICFGISIVGTGFVLIGVFRSGRFKKWIYS